MHDLGRMRTDIPDLRSTRDGDLGAAGRVNPQRACTRESTRA